MIEKLDVTANLTALLVEIYSNEGIAMQAEFKLSINAYLPDLVYSPVHSLADIIAFNNKHPVLLEKFFTCWRLRSCPLMDFSLFSCPLAKLLWRTIHASFNVSLPVISFPLMACHMAVFIREPNCIANHSLLTRMQKKLELLLFPNVTH